MGAWPDGAPAGARRQVERVVEGARAAFGDALAGVTLHGSLAMGCFNPQTSDVDVLVVVERPPEPGELGALAGTLLAVSGDPYEVELTVVRAADLDPFVHPAPSEFHFAEHVRAMAERTAAGEGPAERSTDPDTAAHVVMAIARGAHLAGRPLGEVCPGVPVRDFIDSLAGDLAGIRSTVEAHPLYAVLNCCRLLHFVLEGALSSKAEGAAWASDAAPAELQPVLATARARYGGAPGDPPDPRAARAFVEWAGGIFDRVRAVRGW